MYRLIKLGTKDAYYNDRKKLIGKRFFNKGVSKMNVWENTGYSYGNCVMCPADIKELQIKNGMEYDPFFVFHQAKFEKV